MEQNMSHGQQVQHREITERVTSLETGFENLHSDFVDLKSTVITGFRAINDRLSDSSKTNWTAIFGVLAIGGSLYAAAIRPIETDLARHEREGIELNKAVLVQNDKIQQAQVDRVKIDSDLRANENEVYLIRRDGSPVHERRISLLELEIQQMKDKAHDQERDEVRREAARNAATEAVRNAMHEDKK